MNLKPSLLDLPFVEFWLIPAVFVLIVGLLTLLDPQSLPPGNLSLHRGCAMNRFEYVRLRELRQCRSTASGLQPRCARRRRENPHSGGATGRAPPPYRFPRALARILVRSRSFRRSLDDDGRSADSRLLNARFHEGEDRQCRHQHPGFSKPSTGP